MKILKQEIWQGLALPDWRGRFFIECYTESLSVKTPHFHQAKMMGVLGLAEEVLQNIKLFEENDKGKGYLISSLKELRLALNNDLVAGAIFSDVIGVFEECARFFESEKIPKSLIIQLSILCKRIIKEKGGYFERLKDDLLDSVCGVVDLSQKERIAERVYSLTRSYVTLLLGDGYSPTYLFNRSELLTRRTSYAGRIFRDQVRFLFSSLDCKVREFNVFFGLKTNKKATLQSYKARKGVRVLAEIPSKHYTISTKTFSKFNPDLYMMVSVEALDYVGASLVASEVVESENDLLRVFSSKMNLEVCQDCYVEYRAKGHTYQRDVKVGLLNSLLTYDLRSQQLSGYLGFDFRCALDSSAVRTVEGVFKNLRQVKDSTRLEQKLLSLWMSLEALSYSGDDRSIISSVVNFLPKLYAIKSIEQRLIYVLSLLNYCGVLIPESVRRRHSVEDFLFSKGFDISKFYEILICEDSAREICVSLVDMDFIYFRFYGLYKLLSVSKDVRLRIKNTRSDIEGQLYRIYSKRNSIVHVGRSGGGLSYYMVNHLSDYVNTLLILVFDVVSSARHPVGVTLNDILLSVQLVVDNKFKAIDGGSINGYEDLHLEVII